MTYGDNRRNTVELFLQESLTPRERQQAQEVNALGLPVTIHLEDQMIPLPSSYVGPMEGSAGPEGTSLWRSDTDGDLARWLNNGFTPRAAGIAAASLAAAQHHQHYVMHFGCISHLVSYSGMQLGIAGYQFGSKVQR